MDWEHEYYQNASNANRCPTKAFYLNVLQNGMGAYSHEEVAECISAYHAAEDDYSPPAAVASQEPHEHQEPHDLQAVGGSGWFNDVSARFYSEVDSEMEYVPQYHHAAEMIEPTKSGPSGVRCLLGEERRDERNGSRKVLPPRNLSEVSRPQVKRDVPVLDCVDEVSTSMREPEEAPSGKWLCRQPECRMTFFTRNKLFTHL
jgi:hypothetical protein